MEDETASPRQEPKSDHTPSNDLTIEAYQSLLSEAGERELLRELDDESPFDVERPFRASERLIESETDIGGLTAPTAFDPSKLAATLKTTLGEIGVVGYAYAIARQGVVLNAGGEGWARAPWEGPSAGRPMTAETHLTIASLSKPLTAVAMMHLRETTDLQLDDPFYPYLEQKYSDVHPDVEQITIRQLLTHTSGWNQGCELPSNHPEYSPCLTCSNLTTLFTKPVLAPGAKRYDNVNFCVLREVIEAVSKQSYIEYVTDEVLSAMGIMGMSCKPNPENATLYYSLDYPPGSHAQFMYGSTFGDFTPSCSAYGWYGSALDLARFLAHVRYHSLLSKSTTDEMLFNKLGWGKAYSSRGPHYGHLGAWTSGGPAYRGFVGVLMLCPDEIDAVLLLNTVRRVDKGTSVTFEPNPCSVLIDAYEGAYS